METYRHRVQYAVYERLPKKVLEVLESLDPHRDADYYSILIAPEDANKDSEMKNHFGLWLNIDDERPWTLRIVPEEKGQNLESEGAIIIKTFPVETQFESWYVHTSYLVESAEARTRDLSCVTDSHGTIIPIPVHIHNILILALSDTTCTKIHQELINLIYQTEWFVDSNHPWQPFIVTERRDREIVYQLRKSLDPGADQGARQAMLRQFMAAKYDQKLIVGVIRKDPERHIDDAMIVGYFLLYKNQLISMGAVPDERKQGLGEYLIRKAYSVTSQNLYILLPIQDVVCQKKHDKRMTYRNFLRWIQGLNLGPNVMISDVHYKIKSKRIPCNCLHIFEKD